MLVHSSVSDIIVVLLFKKLLYILLVTILEDSCEKLIDKHFCHILWAMLAISVLQWLFKN